MYFGCVGPREISSKGLVYAKIGAEMPQKGAKRLKGHAVRDTLFDQDGYQWRASVLKYKRGKVYIEEDFLGEGKVNRIRIETPELLFNKQYSVGMPLESLKELAEEWSVYYLEDYKLLDLTTAEFPEIHFLIHEEGYEPDGRAEQDIQLKDLTNTSKIVAIVVM